MFLRISSLLLVLSSLLSVSGQLNRGNNSFRFIAHRGASYLAPENSLAAIKLAWELGADGAECDVRLSSDMQVVVFHDKNTNKLTGENHVVADTPYEILKTLRIKPGDNNLPEYKEARIPLLKDLLESIPPDKMLVIEIKTGPEILPFLKGVVDRYWTSGKIAFISFDFDAIRQAKAIYKNVPCYYLSAFKSNAKKHIDLALQNNLDGLNLRHSIIDTELSELIREAGLDLWCWTVNDPASAWKMKHSGVSAITTDRPKWLKEQIYPPEVLESMEQQGRIEAESGLYRQMLLERDTGASGGAYLAMQDSAQVKWALQLEKGGYYQVNICYRTGGGDKMQYLQKNDGEIACGFEMARDWNIFSQAFLLDSGLNNLGIREGWGNMDIDWIALEDPVKELVITPKKNRFYLETPQNLVFKVDNYHQGVRGVIIAGQALDFNVQPYPHQESAIWLNIDSSQLKDLPEGSHKVAVILEKEALFAQLNVQSSPKEAELMVVAPDVEHGSAMILRLPSGRHMLIDCGKDWVRDSILIPMLQRHHIDTIQTFILTHYHGDHDGGDSGKIIKDLFFVQEFMDYTTHPTGYEWEEDGVKFKVLNAYADGEDENKRSLSLHISYKGFTLIHGGDTYAVNQQQILKRFPGDVPAQVFYANHHFHGSVDPEYIKAINPDLVILQAQEAIYARSAYMVKYKQEVEKVLNQGRDTPLETLPALEVGCIVLRIDESGAWDYETYRQQDGLIIPGF